MPDAKDTRESPFCIELRSKRYYFLSAPALDRAEFLDGSNDCWCARTQMRLGPDGDPVHVDDCQRGRACFQSPSGPSASSLAGAPSEVRGP
jgi:hypothetical protein